jgi:hypothetical protein
MMADGWVIYLADGFGEREVHDRSTSLEGLLTIQLPGRRHCLLRGSTIEGQKLLL